MTAIWVVAAALGDDPLAAAIRAAVVVVVAGIATWLAGPVTRRGVGRLLDRGSRASEQAAARAETRAQTVSSMLTAVTRVAIWTVAALLVLGELGFELAPLIAGAGIVGLAIGFGAQSLVADFISGLFMLVEDQLGVGDWVDVGETAGVVEQVGLRTTGVRSLDGLFWTVRNAEIARTANANQGWGRAVVDVGVAYGADLRRAAEVIKRAADEVRADPEHADKFLEEPEVWGVQDLGDDAVAVRLVATTRPAMQWGVARALRLRTKEVLDEAGIEIPFPQRTLWLRTEPDMLTAPIPVRISERADGPRPDA